jgi:hypothetical protein
VTTLRLDLFEIASAHEALGDLSDKDKCFYYGLATQELDRQSSLIKGDFLRQMEENFHWRQSVAMSTGTSTL